MATAATATKREKAAIAAAPEICVERDPADAVEQSEAVPQVSVASPEAASVPSKRAAKTAKKPKVDAAPSLSPSAAEIEAESNKNIAATVDHPYLSFLHKRIRLYKKKLEKIRQLEAARANDGKVLNDQQLEVVGNKSLVDKMIVEFESLREQFIDVYLKEEADKTAAPTPTVEPTEPTPTPPTPPTLTEPKEDFVTPDGKMPAVVAASNEVPRDAFAYVEDLLRTLHAVTRHQSLGEEVPLALDYFAKVLLGTTRPPVEVPFDENLAESLVEATRYLTKSDKTLVLNFTYQDLRAMVEQLGVKIEETPEVADGEEEEDDVALEATSEVVAPSAEELPHINFFTDSQLEESVAVVENGGVTEDKDNQHDKAAEAIDPTVSEEESAEETPVAEVVVAALETSAPPKSFAEAATEKAVWNRKPKSVTAPMGGSGDDKPNQRRRSQGRSKGTSNNNSSSPRKGEPNANGDGTKPSSNANKPRRPRPQRSNDENSGPLNVNLAPNVGGKNDERRPRSDRPVRKQQTQSQQAKGTTKV